MLWIGILIVLLGLVLLAFGGPLTRHYISRNNPEAHSYSAAEFKSEWESVAGKRVVPTWVSVLVLCGWTSLLSGGITILSAVL